MTNYQIFLTKSHTAAVAIARGFSCDLEKRKDEISCVRYGSADNFEAMIPTIYLNKGYCCCVVERENADDSKAPRYNLIFC